VTGPARGEGALQEAKAIKAPQLDSFRRLHLHLHVHNTCTGLQTLTARAAVKLVTNQLLGLMHRHPPPPPPGGRGVTKAGRMRRWWWHGCGRLSKMMKVRGSQVGLGQQLA
jgi:hypothetical protein